MMLIMKGSDKGEKGGQFRETTAAAQEVPEHVKDDHEKARNRLTYSIVHNTRCLDI